ncbi:hypothetical protein IU429_13470 [Nocardia elegans]|uniref:Secreted protein n=1 Tax=Nocardia elegans TaxID=300029 RepID=A0ABW6T8X7_9NOCA|nr:hypothetical protein [Nocardia elegans]MBF6448678.1 hypothetical protein [Nocardia elegans]
MRMWPETAISWPFRVAISVSVAAAVPGGVSPGVMVPEAMVPVAIAPVVSAAPAWVVVVPELLLSLLSLLQAAVNSSAVPAKATDPQADARQ